MKVCPRCKNSHDGKHCYCKPCHTTYQREQHRKRNANNPSPRMKRILEGKGKVSDHPCARMFYSAVHRARKKGLEFSLNMDDLVVPERCPVLGIPLDKRDLQHTPSLDRVDSSRGYTPDNVRIISFRANSIKQDATLEEILAVAEYMKNVKTSER